LELEKNGTTFEGISFSFSSWNEPHSKQCDQMSWWENRPKCSPTRFCQYQYVTLNVEKSGPKIWATFLILKTALRKQSPSRRKFAQSGHPECKAFFSSLSTGNFKWFVAANVENITYYIFFCF
jgi:hypothetical protein